MREVAFLSFVFAVGHLALGCSTSTSSVRMVDSGGITLTDSGPRDGSTTPRDGSSSGCPEDVVPRYSGTPCADSTRTCIMGCGTLPEAEQGGCIVMCIDGDPSMGACGECLDQNIISCANGMGCQSQWDLGACCIEDNCATVPDAGGCVEAACGSEQTAYISCIQSLPAGACGSAFTACFPAPTMFSSAASDGARFDSVWRPWMSWLESQGRWSILRDSSR